MLIKVLFDPAKDIYRSIEKVITYNAAQETRLRTEISEYIVTDSIEDQLERLLLKMQAAMEAGGQNEVGVWLSGFYGSGKSSFTKYLALALDGSVTVDGVPFLELFAARLNRAQTIALLRAVARQFPATVILVDLASDMLAGAQMEDVSTVLYYKVLQWAGFSRNLKVAALERRLQLDGCYVELEHRIEQELGTSWREVQNDPLVIDSLLPEIVHALYPTLFRTPTAFSTETVEFVRSLNDQVVEMLDIVQRRSGRRYVLFVIDEVGQYVADHKHLILNLQGLAENLKHVGDGRAWLIGTAQQTLTEDDPKAALNSPELYKLKDRFPIQIDLESSDIKEICYRRLLGKSAVGEATLGEIFDRSGPALRHNTRLEDARAYTTSFDRQTFINLYPFLPAHFDILLYLLGVLAKSTGGFGLRSAIKVIQDILIERSESEPAAADRPMFLLAPYLVFGGFMATFVVLPFGANLVAADLDVGLLYLLAIAGPVVIGILMAGWASNSKWALFGGIRSAAQLVSYEIPSAFALMTVVLAAGTLSMQGIVRAQGGWPWEWFLFRNPFLFIAYFVSLTASVAEGNRTPFDLPEGESELVAGFHVEYSGMRFLWFMFAEWGNLWVISALATVGFLGGWQVPGVSPETMGAATGWAFVGWQALSFAVFAAKVSLVVAFVIQLRWTVPRLRVDQMMLLCWKYLVPLALACVAGALVLLVAVPQGGWLDWTLRGSVALVFLWLLATYLRSVRTAYVADRDLYERMEGKELWYPPYRLP